MNNTTPDKKNDKNARPKFNSNWIFAFLAISIILFEILFNNKSTQKASTAMIKEMVANRDIEKIMVVNNEIADVSKR